MLEFQQGQCSKAVPHFEKAERLFESQVPALHAYATCLVKLKRFKAAADVLKKLRYSIRTIPANDRSYRQFS